MRPRKRIYGLLHTTIRTKSVWKKCLRSLIATVSSPSSKISVLTVLVTKHIIIELG